jgi:hypothetical protein
MLWVSFPLRLWGVGLLLRLSWVWFGHLRTFVCSLGRHAALVTALDVRSTHNALLSVAHRVRLMGQKALLLDDLTAFLKQHSFALHMPAPAKTRRHAAAFLDGRDSDHNFGK